MEKLIITVAPVGSVPKKKDTPHVPVTVQEIIDCALRCEDAGAALIHIHVRDKEEQSSDDPELFAKVVDAQQAGALTSFIDRPLIVVTAGSGAQRGWLATQDEMASLSTGSVNFPTHVYSNSTEMVEKLAGDMKRLDIKPEMEIFDVAMIENAVSLHEKGLAESPLHFNLVMGVRGGIPAHIDHLVHMVRSLPSNSTWTVSSIGRFQLPMGVHALLMGGHVRVGLEDNIYLKKGVLATNEQLIERVVRLAGEFGRDVATPDEARKILSLSPR